MTASRAAFYALAAGQNHRSAPPFYDRSETSGRPAARSLFPPSSALPLGTKIATRSGGCKREGDFGRRTNLPGDLGRARSRCSPTLSSSASGGAKKMKRVARCGGRLRASRGGREAGWVGRGLDPVYVGLRGCWRAGSLRCTWGGSRMAWASAPRLKLQRATDASRALFRK